MLMGKWIAAAAGLLAAGLAGSAAAGQLPPGKWWLIDNPRMLDKVIIAPTYHPAPRTVEICNDQTSPGPVWIIVDHQIPEPTDTDMAVEPGACQTVTGSQVEVALSQGVPRATGLFQILPDQP